MFQLTRVHYDKFTNFISEIGELKIIKNMTELFDIIQLMDKNVITRLSKDYEGKLLNKIKDTFTSSRFILKKIKLL